MTCSKTQSLAGAKSCVAWCRRSSMSELSMDHEKRLKIGFENHFSNFTSAKMLKISKHKTADWVPSSSDKKEMLRLALKFELCLPVFSPISPQGKQKWDKKGLSRPLLAVTAWLPSFHQKDRHPKSQPNKAGEKQKQIIRRSMAPT